MYKLYEFIDDGPEDDPEGPAFIGPIPTVDIRTIRGENIPRAGRLIDLMSKMSMPNAFLVWASETLGIFEAAHRASHDIDVDSLEGARFRFGELLNATRGAPWSARLPLMREALAAFPAQGLSFRETASYLDVPLHVVVHVQGSPNVQDPERYANLEEALMRGDLRRRSARALLLEYGSMDFNAFRHLCVLHSIDAKAAQRTRAVAA